MGCETPSIPGRSADHLLLLTVRRGRDRGPRMGPSAPSCVAVRPSLAAQIHQRGTDPAMARRAKSKRLRAQTTTAMVTSLAVGLRLRHTIKPEPRATARISANTIDRSKFADRLNSSPLCDCWIRARSRMAQSKAASAIVPRPRAAPETTRLVLPVIRTAGAVSE
jgi:hypothetical protein